MTHILDHPVIADRLSRLRQPSCEPADFRRYLREIAQLMVPYVTQNLPTVSTQVETPLESMEGKVLAKPIVLAPILRAGLGLLEGFHQLLPEASVAHIGMARNEETLQPETYYFNVPASMAHSTLIVLDPMLATGGSASAAITELKQAGASSILFACLVACPEGVERLQNDHPDVDLYAAALDRELNDVGYILPGLGDAGDRIFGTL